MLRNLILVLFVSVLLCSGADAQTAKWQKFSSDEGKFSVMMPCKAEVDVEKPDPEDEDAVEQTFYSCSLESGYFMVTYTDFKEVIDDKGMLDAYRDGIAEGATIVSEKSITLGSTPGRELVLSKTTDEIEQVFKWRFYLRGHRIYALTVGTEKPRAGSPDMTKFLNSFKIGK